MSEQEVVAVETGDLKKKTLSGVVWKFMERMSGQLVSLVISIVLARLLTPDDYSVVGIVGIFFAFANVLITGGFNTALIQKKNATIKDYSSILWISVTVAIALYAIVFFSAPWIAELYEKPLLVPIFRVMGLMLILNAVKSVLSAYVSSSLQFKKFFTSSVVSLIISGSVGVIMAYCGCGPWALVAQNMIHTGVNIIVLLFMTKARFVLKVYFKESISLFRYGWKMLAASIFTVAYNEVYPLIIGLKYSATDLSFYTKGKSFPQLLNSSITDTLSAVLFPVMSKIQDEKGKVLNYVRNFMRVSSFFVFPMMIGFFVVSDGFVLLLLTEKWLPASAYIKIFCIAFMFDIINVGNLQAIQALGRSDLVLIMEIIKKTSYAVVILIFVFLTDSPELLALASVINALIALVVNSFPNRKLIGYKYRYQIMDLLPNLITAVVMGVIVYLVGLLNINIFAKLVLQVLIGVISYIALNILTRNPNMKYILDFIKTFFGKGKTKNGKENNI